jgi:DNA-binding MarR family transcriptional regulator/GNAT superfamily N-acetyltransferase
MDDSAIAQVRRFNRTVTQRVGALHDHYLGGGRPLGEARVLWEIGEQGCDVRTLRARLDLDSGYLSRLLRSLEAADLVTVSASDDDKRRRTARLTKKGRRERAVLDERSEVLARTLLDPLTDTQRDRLVVAMSEVERLLTGALVEIDAVDPAQPSAQHCLGEYFAELDRRFDTGFDPAGSRPLRLDEMRSPAGTFLVASLHGEAIGCGALKFHGGGRTGANGAAETKWAEIKRMWVAESARGLGVGRRLLTELERRAAGRGHSTVRLDTNRSLTAAIAMYRSAGYQEVDPYNDEPYAHHWFEKHLDARST